MNYADELFADLRQVLTSDGEMPRRYRLLWRLLDRMLKERTGQDRVEYQGLVPRIYALCERYGVSHQPLCVLHSNVLRTNHGEYAPEEADFLYDAKALAQAVSAFYGCPLPEDIAGRLPAVWRTLPAADRPLSDRRLRFLVKDWDAQVIRGYDVDDPTQSLLRVAHTPEWQLCGQLYPLATLNLLDVATDPEGILHPRLFILEPDFLVDITSICQCVKESGPSPYFHLLAKFMPREDSLALQLGNVANQFLDDTLNTSAPFLESMQRSFRDYPLQFCTLAGVDDNFFGRCRAQYANIRTAVAHHFHEAGIRAGLDEVQLEPSFVCDALGLQGRMDLLTADLTKIVELKSGKQDEFHATFRLEHAMQMALYKEILHYGLGRARQEVKTLLLYSRYPVLHDIRLGTNHIAQALCLRNGIVFIERQLRTNAEAFLAALDEEAFNPTHCQSKLYTGYVRPRIEAFLQTIRSASPLERDYFCTMTAFVAREQMLAKVGDDRADSDRGFAQAWLCDTDNKRLHGNIITDLRLTPRRDAQGRLTHVVATLPADDTSQPNFREGDSVILYERNTEADLMTNRQSLRCQVEELHADRLLLRFSHPQRGNSGLRFDRLFAIEPAHSDALFASLYRGLYALLTCEPRRRALVLGMRKPERNTSAEPRQPIEDKDVEEIVRAMLRSEDYYLLVGPPGSGKTNIALRHMVSELLRQDEQDNLLLMAYTNRAVDEICQMLEQLFTEQAPVAYVRLGQELSCAPSLRHRLLRNVIAPCRNRRETLDRLRPVRIFCATVASLCGLPELFRLRHFRTAILDEASQVLEPQLLPLLTATGPDRRPAIDRLVLIGDHKQLPAVVVQHSEQSRVTSQRLLDIGLRNCRDSFFERLHRLAPPELVGMLTRQGRMHTDISQWASHTYYGDRLTVVPLPHQTGTLGWTEFDRTDPSQTLLATRRMGAIDVRLAQPEANNKVNAAEAAEVARLIAALHALHVRNGRPWTPSASVGVIVPFRGQIAAVRRALLALSVPQAEDITIDTVERYQGSQREVILFTTVVSRHYQLKILSEPVESDGMLIDRKLNVAVTRARRQFVLVGNLALLRHAPDYERLIRYIESLA